MLVPDLSRLAHVMSTMQVTLSPLRATVALSLAGKCTQGAPLAKLRQLAWCYILVLPSVVAVLCLAQLLSSTRGKRTPLFRRQSPLISSIIFKFPGARGLPAPAREGLEIIQRNGRVCTTRGSRIVRLDAAHYSISTKQNTCLC